jgi:hypothetical protein
LHFAPDLNYRTLIRTVKLAFYIRTIFERPTRTESSFKKIFAEANVTSAKGHQVRDNHVMRSDMQNQPMTMQFAVEKPHLIAFPPQNEAASSKLKSLHGPGKHHVAAESARRNGRRSCHRGRHTDVRGTNIA